MPSSATEPKKLPALSYAAVLASAFFCYAALGSVVRVLPRYVPGRLGGGSLAIGLAVGAPALSAILARPAGGRLSDRRGPLPVLVAGAAVMAVGAPLALLESVPALLASRLIVGAGEGLMMSATALWLLRLGGPGRRGRSIGHVGLANYGGLVAGPLLAVAIDGQKHPGRVFLIGVALPLAGAALALVVRPGHGGPADGGRRASVREVIGWTLRPGLGLMLVNVGFASMISFGAAAIVANRAGGSAVLLPVFAAVVIIVRGGPAGGIPDRFGAEPTLLACCPVAALGLLGVGILSSTPLVLLSLVLFSAGQALAVPALGAIALRRAPSAQHGSAAGLFFAWYDAGVGIGAPLAGLAAASTGAGGALVTAALLFAGAPLVAGALLLRPAPASAPSR